MAHPIIKLENKVIVVTGASRGIGLAIARLATELGGQVVMLSRSRNRLNREANRIHLEVKRNRPVVFSLDVGFERGVRRVFSRIKEKFGRIDWLVNNAGELVKRDFKALSLRDWNKVLNTNLTGAFLCSREAVRYMNDGHIIHISSLAGLRGTQKFRGLSPYTVSKFGLVGLTEAMATELAPRIRVNCLALGAVNTQMLKRAGSGLRSKTHPEDIAIKVVKLGQRAVSGRVIAVRTNL